MANKGGYGGVKDILRHIQETGTSHNIFPRIWNTTFYNRKGKNRGGDNRITPSSFQKILFLLSSQIRKDDYLFSLNSGAEPYFSLEGKVMKIYEAQQ